ncbi:competence type IV pilus minor pilin ComGD [Sporolactobacillus kofuensis]|uniref:Competence type IV pilus minor pilin ComGD n=1 Tax=Sporolactobacillus kofuensis TaxID=269672 RepID=A0ABW1WGA2_9BACL|nr:competence type IV pilus minor pilin ComGD [Sporolactobacillus kofuensis]MCO7176520.1 type II secretion system GspH family protein [Sporolactobacillus kofuensis]
MMQKQVLSARHKCKFLTQSGFTLIELLIVVSIACILAPLSFLSFSNFSDKMTIKQFAEDVQETIHDAQMEAITQSKTVRIVFNNQDHYFYVSRNNQIERKEMNKRIMVYNSFGETAISINRLGHFSRSSTYTISMGTIRYKLVLLLGQGRFYVEKAS